MSPDHAITAPARRGPPPLYFNSSRDNLVVCDEYPDERSRHYPVLTPEREHERRNRELQNQVRRAAARPVFFCGRLANYEYINQDQAIAQGLATARTVMDHLRA